MVNAIVSDRKRQDNGAYTIGDVVLATCTTFGEEIIQGHSGEMECLPTGFWSHAPVCRSMYLNVMLLHNFVPKLQGRDYLEKNVVLA